MLVDLVLDVLLRCLESLERNASDSSDQQETSAALKEVKCLWNNTEYNIHHTCLCVIKDLENTHTVKLCLEVDRPDIKILAEFRMCFI